MSARDYVTKSLLRFLIFRSYNVRTRLRKFFEVLACYWNIDVGTNEIGLELMDIVNSDEDIISFFIYANELTISYKKIIIEHAIH
ncbi:unnamed protein product [Rhizophagus irregularis]|nr:unnamed protein product [Rhizophagus irregularis]